jgi:hypothetical protein
MTTNTNNAPSPIMIKSAGRTKSQDVQILTEEQISKCTSLSDAIRKCRDTDKSLSCGTIARFVTRYYHKVVSTNHVYNVLHTTLKRK